MPSGKHRKRLEVSQELYYGLEQRAIWLHMPTAKLAELLLWEGLNMAAQRAPMPAQSQVGEQWAREGPGHTAS